MRLLVDVARDVKKREMTVPRNDQTVVQTARETAALFDAPPHRALMTQAAAKNFRLRKMAAPQRTHPRRLPIQRVFLRQLQLHVEERLTAVDDRSVR
ncbi:hypothetical protein SDC9_210916 [bioreactor metagenome]|uniref:Uncharacterized protein n=1 Tax=bioreactor metagenome TaxID=1076179 RepID=A0A645JIW3_9ZZZZ